MRNCLLVKWFEKLPQPRPVEDAVSFQSHLANAQSEFRRQVLARYNEGTLQRLLQCEDAQTRRAATVALGLLGTFDSNRLLADRLHDEDELVRQYAADSLWMVWYRGDDEQLAAELQKVTRIRDLKKALQGLDELIAKAGGFAEAINQRAIIYFRLGQYQKAITDCERVLELNPVHFGAQAGLGQCQLRLDRPRAALKAFKNATRINPNLEEVCRAIRELEESLGKDDRKG